MRIASGFLYEYKICIYILIFFEAKYFEKDGQYFRLGDIKLRLCLYVSFIRLLLPGVFQRQLETESTGLSWTEQAGTPSGLEIDRGNLWRGVY